MTAEINFGKKNMHSFINLPVNLCTCVYGACEDILNNSSSNLEN